MIRRGGDAGDVGGARPGGGIPERPEDGEEPTGLGRLLKDGGDVVRRDADGPRRPEGPKALVPGVVPAPVRAHDDDAGVPHELRPVVAVVVRHERVVARVDDEERDAHVAESLAARRDVVRPRARESGRHGRQRCAGPPPPRRRAGAVVEAGERTRLGTIRRAGDGRDVTIVHHGRAVPRERQDAARVLAARALVGEARVGPRVAENAPSHAAREDLAVRRVFRLGDEVRGTQKIHAARERDGRDERRRLAGGREVLNQQEGGRGVRDAEDRRRRVRRADRLDGAREVPPLVPVEPPVAEGDRAPAAALAAPRQVLHVVVVARAADAVEQQDDRRRWGRRRRARREEAVAVQGELVAVRDEPVEPDLAAVERPDGLAAPAHGPQQQEAQVRQDVRDHGLRVAARQPEHGPKLARREPGALDDRHVPERPRAAHDRPLADADAPVRHPAQRAADDLPATPAIATARDEIAPLARAPRADRLGRGRAPRPRRSATRGWPARAAPWRPSAGRGGGRTPRRRRTAGAIACRRPRRRTRRRGPGSARSSASASTRRSAPGP